jgi:H+/Cl- antiporter ClcA
VPVPVDPVVAVAAAAAAAGGAIFPSMALGGACLGVLDGSWVVDIPKAFTCLQTPLG